MAAYAALVSLLNNIHAITNHPTLSTSLHNIQVQPLLEKTSFLLDFIKGNTYGGVSKELQDLERQIASSAHAAEDVIESHIVDQIHEGRSTWPYLLTLLLKCVCCHICDRSEKPLDLLQQINEDMDAILKAATEFKEKHILGVENLPAHLAVAAGPLRESGESCMVGLDAELNQLLDKLTRYGNSRRIVSIVGMAGMGKTTLAKSVYENAVIKEQFEFRAWATVSQKSNRNQILSELLSAQVRFREVYDLGSQLHKTLFGRRYLIVLDDIWSVSAWDKVKFFFPDNNDGSRILLTTRLSYLAKCFGSSLFEMSLLDEEKSWKLFREKAFHNEDCPPELLEVGKKIVKLCKGLPSSIVRIRDHLLQSPRAVGYWKKVEKYLKSIPDSKEKQESLDALSLSYYHLPPHLKPCFLYMGGFKEDSEIRFSNIIKLWVAEGFIKPIGSQSLEELVEDYIGDLIDRNLISAGKRNKKGKVATCIIHGLSRDLCMKLAEQEEFFHVSTRGIRGIERRLVDDKYLERTGVKLPLARSIMTQGYVKQPTEYRLLRVLDEDGYNLEADYYGNVNLRYLAYSPPDNANAILELPASISLIWNLQTLIIKRYFRSLVVAPTEFWYMRQLRHMKCYQIYLPCPPKRNGQDCLLMLDNLRTLKRVVNLRLCEEVCQIIPNIKNLHLLYDRELLGYDDSLFECLCNLDRLHKLKSLNLSIKSSILLGTDEELEKKLIATFPTSLNKLSLRGSKLHWDDLIKIGSLPQLEVLNLDSLSVYGERWSSTEGLFPRLKFLKIDGCYLTHWDAESSDFPRLEKLILINLQRLEEIPSDIGDIPRLKLIRVDGCSTSAAVSAVIIKENNLELYEEESVRVQVRMSDSEVERFNEMLEAEELTAHNIELELY